eukprot:1344547-Karenia_brevis.AAC.1
MFVEGDVARFAKSIIVETQRRKLMKLAEASGVEQTRSVISRYVIGELMRTTGKTTITTTI